MSAQFKTVVRPVELYRRNKGRVFIVGNNGQAVLLSRPCLCRETSHKPRPHMAESGAGTARTRAHNALALARTHAREPARDRPAYN